MMKVTNIFRRLRQHGLWRCVRWSMLRANDRWLEWRLGITTSGMVHWRDLGLKNDSESYEPIDYGTFAYVADRIPVRPNDVFLDYGCGMGRVVVLAAQKPFRRVIGVELSSWLCGIAENNLQIVQRRLICKSVHVINMDASEFPVPTDVSVVWLFSPFFGEVMRKVTSQIRESLEISPREITIIHIIPDNVSSLFRECDWLGLTAEFRVGVWKQLTCFVFKNIDCPRV